MALCVHAGYRSSYLEEHVAGSEGSVQASGRDRSGQAQGREDSAGQPDDRLLADQCRAGGRHQAQEEGERHGSGRQEQENDDDAQDDGEEDHHRETDLRRNQGTWLAGCVQKWNKLE